ncbi:MAG TPA: B12-binding domain-containing protein [Candidatus Binatia bacterium]|jgi:methanogenic corrinoid protein MtbC1/DNA-binding XRE family transcriptional regulator
MPGEVYRKQYSSALLRGDSEAAAGAVEEAIAEGMALSEIYMKLLAPSLRHVGDLWTAGKISVAQEHLATQITLAQMEKLRSLHRARNRLSYYVLTACVEGEEHFVGARMIADLFALEGWAVEFLGPNVPTSALIDMVRERRPHLLALSVTMKQGVQKVFQVIQGVRSVQVPPKVIVGGSAVHSPNLSRAKSPDWEMAADAVAGLKLGRNLLHSAHPKALLAEYLKNLGRRVRELRVGAGWTQQQLAEATKLARPYIVSVEGGNQNISIDVLLRLANALRVRPETLLSGRNPG